MSKDGAGDVDRDSASRLSSAQWSVNVRSGNPSEDIESLEQTRVMVEVTTWVVMMVIVIGV
jgi:hypothetical protein